METPCIKVCKVSDGKCLGCGRTLEQIRLWSRYPSEERLQIMKGLQMEELVRELFRLLDIEETTDDGRPFRPTRIYCSREFDRMALEKVFSELKAMVT